MKKPFLLLTGVLALMALTGCEPNEPKYTISELEEYNYRHIPIKQVGDHLYEVNNDNYWTSYAYNPFASGSEFNGIKEWHGVCAGIRNGNFFGRNLDWSCSDQPEFIIRTPATDGHHATIGVCASNMVKKNPDADTRWLSQMLVNDLTQCCYDGINDAGVCMVVLVVHHVDDIIPTGTNPSAKISLHGSNVVRYVIDNAGSAAEGVELLKNANVYGSLEHYTFHWLLSDEKENYFVELINNSVVATRVEENPITEYRTPIITNFYMQKSMAVQHEPGGTERYDILAEEYEQATTAEGMFGVLKDIRFSRKYLGKDPRTLAHGEKDPNWYSEFYSEMPDYNDLSKKTYFTKDSSHVSIWKQAIEPDILHNSIYMLREKGISPRLNPLSSWTVHTSVYNIKERSLQVVTAENYDKIYPTRTTSFPLLAK